MHAGGNLKDEGTGNTIDKAYVSRTPELLYCR
jgi:hypothetical protein